MNKRNIFLWALYDFANSIPTIVFGLYFSQWLVIDNHVSDIFYNLIFVASSILLILISPWVGAASDRHGAKLPFLRILTLLMTVTILITTILAVFFPASNQIVFWAVIFFILTNFFYQFSLIFYNALLPQLAPKSKIGRVSGIGSASGWIGQIAGILITLPLATGAIYLAGNHGRPQTFLLSVILFIILSLPTLILFKEKTQKKYSIEFSLVKEYKNYFSDFKTMIKVPGIGRFLLGYFFFSDAILTAQSNFPIYLDQVFRIPDKIKAFLAMGILITAALGAFLIGFIADKYGIKKTLNYLLIAWMILMPFIALTSNFHFFIFLVVVMGILFGATYVVTRATITYLTPEDQLGHTFSFYTLAERFSTFLGPVVWGLITTILYHSGPLRYRMAALSMTVFMVIGFFILKSIPSDKKE